MPKTGARRPRYRPQAVPRHVATVDDVTQIWTLHRLGYTWVQIAAMLGLTLRAITHARRAGSLAQEETP